jgi:uncharacterized protein YndB with AHSA1/START domain
MNRMTLETQGDKDVVVTRRFAASPEAVYRAHAEPRLIQKWLFGPDGADAPARPTGYSISSSWPATFWTWAP